MTRVPKVYVAFLRGINVGGNTLISMTALKDDFEQMGMKEVVTYINSGNVVFQSAITDERKLERAITKQLEAHFRKEVATVVLGLEDMDRLIESLPTSWRKPAEEKRNVIFLRHTIDNAELLDNFKAKPDIESLFYIPRALLWSAKTSDLTRSNMIKLSSSPLYKEMTVRTLGTVQKVHALMHKSTKTP